MAIGIANSYTALSNLNLWLRNRSGTDLTHADIPQIIPLRWPYFRDNWNTTLLPQVQQSLQTLPYPSVTQAQLDEFTNLIDIQRNSTAIANPFQNTNIFYQYYFIFDAIPLSSAPISTQEQNLITNTLNTIDNYTKNDFLTMKTQITAARDQLADQMSGTDPTYNQIFSRSPVTATLQPSINGVAQMQQLQNALVSIDFILANIYSINTTYVDPFALAKANANNPDFDINSYTSGRLVRLFYGESLEDLAERYLGDPDLWIDIAIANGLQPPYIDEAGSVVPLLANADGDQINVAAVDSMGNDNNEKFFINQVVILQSNTQPPQSFTVGNITQIPVSGELVIALNTSIDLSIFNTTDDAYVRVFLPNTINSKFFILIPSNDAPPVVPPTIPWFLGTLSNDLQQMQVDLAVGPDGDLVFDSTNDFSLSYGLANAIQAMKLKIVVEQGTLQRHPEFGFANVQGQRNINVDASKQQIINSITESVENDPRFDRLESLDVQYFGNNTTGATGFNVTLTVRLAGTSNTVPITFSVNLS